MKMFDNLHLMDKKLEEAHAIGESSAYLDLYTLHEAEDLMRLLVARNAYSSVAMEAVWTHARNSFSYRVAVFEWLD